MRTCALSAGEFMRMNVTFRRTNFGCETCCTRADGSQASWESPMAGPIPNDVVHWVVENYFRLRSSFFGHIAAGEGPTSVKELGSPGTELSWTEMMVLSVQGQLAVQQGGAHTAPQMPRAGYGVRYPDYCSAEDVANIVEALESMRSRWSQMEVGQCIEVTYP